ncbi:MAG: ACT domain-containing protein, partial [Syntrophomonadaceae bacterium]|nr:ACT domain-containing protein [Syntrophomonadaceae bacterium]
KKEAQSLKRYKNLITAHIYGKDGEIELAGTISRARIPILVEIDGYETESHLEGYVLLVKHEDRPRIIGPVAMQLGDAGVNIAGMKVARKKKGEQSIMLINVDNKIEDKVLKALGNSDGVSEAPVLLHF